MKNTSFRLDYSEHADFSQPLVDISSTGRIRDWNSKKDNNDMLAYIYDNIDKRKAMRLRDCGSFLVFNKTIDNRLKLKTMNSCRVRLCPVCAWRRSLKIYSHMMKIMNEMNKIDNFSYLFLTLTVKNSSGECLNDSIDLMMASWQRFTQRKALRNVIKGWYRGLEITYNELTDEYHPHFHVVLAVKNSYFKKNYISQALFTQFWKESLSVDYTPIVNVKRVKGDTAKAVCECAKYSVKYTDYIRPDDLELSEKVVSVLDSAIDRRRLVAYGGIFKDIHKKLNLDDEIDGDMINVDITENDSLVTNEEIMYVWHVGYNNYFRSKI